MYDNGDELKHDLECLRLASDLIQMSRDTLNPALRAHCDRMASFWSDQAGRRPNDLATGLIERDQ
jgi:hypothetical protein